MEKLIEGVTALGLKLTPQQQKQFYYYYQELIKWNKQANLTRITDYNEVQVKHFVDSLTVTLALNQIPIGLKVIDVGTGAGFPGLPLKIVFEQIKLVLLESVAKKTAFLHHLIKQLELKEVEIVTGRAEEIAHQPQYREQFSLVLSRAVAKSTVLAELTLPFCQLHGLVILHKKGEINQEIDMASKAINTLGGNLRQVEKIDLAGLSDQRYLVIIDKIRPTPSNYPRRPGIPTRRPILTEAEIKRR